MEAPKVTCFDCIHAHVTPGTPDVHYLPNGDPGYPGDPPEAGCKLPATVVDEATQEAAYEDASGCRCFRFRPAGRCGWCGRPVHAPERLWKRWAGFYEREPACSDGCLAMMVALDGVSWPAEPDEHWDADEEGRPTVSEAEVTRANRYRELTALRAEARRTKTPAAVPVPAAE